MNILPKKSWHVRSRENVARVRRDEAAAEAERRQREARAQRAEQEARTHLLRKKARRGGGGGGSPPPSPPTLFLPPEEAPNREHEEEKRQEQERRERALGVLTYLGQSAAEAQTCPPWYQRPPLRGGRGDTGVGHDPSPPPADEGRKAALDPLLTIRRGLRRPPSPPQRRRTPPASPPPKRSSSGSLVELRRQRLQREAREAERSRALLGRLRDPSPGTQPLPPADERARPYNSQFNPHLARGGRGRPPKR